MTLSKQLVLLLILLLLLVFTGSFMISARNSQQFLVAQLASHAEDAATSLGFSLSRALQEDDQASIESMTDAMFDRGYYREIRVERSDGSLIIGRRLPVKVDNVPAWFVDYVELATPEGAASVMSGWRQIGTVRVHSHPGYAYAQLWRTLSDTLRWFLISAAAAILLGLLLLRWLMKPLHEIEWQADAICRREFPQLEPLPRTPDLRRIVEAMNRLSERVKLMLRESEQLAAGLQRKAYQHPVTELSNRRLFNDTLANLIDSSEEFGCGVLVLVQLHGFKEYNERAGFNAGDERLRATGERIQGYAEQIPHHVVAHLGGSSFVLLAQDYTQQQAETLGAALSAALTGVGGVGTPKELTPIHLGLAYFDGSDTASSLLSRADMALQIARSQGPEGWHLLTPGEHDQLPLRTASQWRAFIEQSLAVGRIRLHFQPVCSCPERTLLHEEVLLRLVDTDAGGNEILLSAADFMPQAERAGLTAELDRAVIGRIMGRLHQQAGRYAVNLSPLSLQTPGFLGWLEHQLRANPVVAGNLVFELAEYGVATMEREVTALVGLLERYGCQLSLDHFGRSFSAFTCLRRFRPNYLKVDGSYTRSLESQGEGQFFLQSLSKIAHGLDIRVIAEAIETEAQWQQLDALNIDGAQGYYLGRPE